MKHALIASLAVALFTAACGVRPAAPDDPEIVAERERLQAIATQEAEAARQSLRAKRTDTDSLSDPVWAAFRQSFPYHIQEIAVTAQPHPDGSRTIIVSEPPPDVTIDDIAGAAGTTLVSYRVQQQPIGNDGWARDAVLRVSGDPATLADVASRLNQTIFHTSYKQHVLPLPASPMRPRRRLDLNVTAAELATWVVQEQERFTPVTGGAAKSVEEVFATPRSTVFFSGRRGLVAWWIPKDAGMDALSAEARQFALDSDLIVGAISRPAGVLVFARERVVPIQELPPLRFETIRLLAAVQGDAKKELQQSYERLAPFAGAMSDGHDWAPILLSPELVDTEYGSLLNITDQILKGWTNRGYTNYIRFERYPRPSDYPFKQPLRVQLRAQSLTYNWNTKGVGYVVQNGDDSVFALNRTGALPVSYLPEGTPEDESSAVAQAEEQGYKYFATLGDPNLVRVVQYAALYQIFTAFGVSGGSSPLARNEFPAQVREQLEKNLQAEIENASDEQLAALAKQIAELMATESQKKDAASAAAAVEMTLKSEGLEPGTEEYAAAKQRLEGIAAILSPSELSEETKAEMAEKVEQALRQVKAQEEPSSAEEQSLRRGAMSMMADLRKMPKTFADTVAAKSDAWIHTPVVVISWNDVLPVIGGHNLYSGATKVEISNDVAPGVPEVIERGDTRIVRLHPADEGRAQSFIRTAAKSAEEEPAVVADRLKRVLQTAPDTPPRPRSLALDLPKTEARLGGQGTPPPEPPSLTSRGLQGDDGGGGWRFDGDGNAPDDRIVPGVIFIERRDDRSIRILFGDGKSAVHASTVEDATDAIVQMLRRGEAGENGARIEMRGFHPDEAEGFVLSCKARSRAGDGEVSTIVEDRAEFNPSAERAVLEHNYDFARAKVRSSPVEVIDGMPQAKISIEIPREGAVARTEVTVAFRPETKRGVVARIVEAMKLRIEKLISGIGAKLDAYAFNFQVNQEIKQLVSELGIPVKKIHHQFNDAEHDLYFVELRPPGWMTGEIRLAA